MIEVKRLILERRRGDRQTEESRGESKGWDSPDGAPSGFFHVPGL